MKILASRILAVIWIGLAGASALAQDLSAEVFTDRERQVVLTEGFDYIIQFHEKRGVLPSKNLEKVLKKARKVDSTVRDLSDLELVRVLVNKLS